MEFRRALAALPRRADHDEYNGTVSTFLSAVRGGRFDDVTALLQIGNVDVNSSRSDGSTALHMAAKNLLMTILLLCRGAAKDAQRNDGTTPLHLAVRNARFMVTQTLLGSGADPNKRRNDGTAPLHLAVKNARIVGLLLRHGAVADHRRNDGATALHLAALGGYEDSARQLLASGTVEIDRAQHDGTTALHLAVRHPELVDLLLCSGANANLERSDGATALHIALQSTKKVDRLQRQRSLQLLLDAGADLSRTWNSGGPWLIPTLTGSCVGQTKANRKTGAAALHMVVREPALVELLLRSKPDLGLKRSDGSTPLHLAAQHGDSNSVKLLLDAGADINCARNDGTTPLHCAVVGDTFHTLLKYGADVNAKRFDGATALHVAVHNGRYCAVQTLLQNGADVNAVQNDGRTPLHMAWRFSAVNELLLRNGATVKAQRNDGETPLHVAVFRKRISIISMLLDRGANVTIRRNDGMTPLHLAIRDVDTMKLLLLHCKNRKILETVLPSAVRKGTLDVVLSLLSNELDIDSRKGGTLLRLAAGKPEVIDKLLASGVADNITREDAVATFRSAVRQRVLRVIQKLVESGIANDCASSDISAAVVLAAEEKDINMVRALSDLMITAWSREVRSENT